MTAPAALDDALDAAIALRRAGSFDEAETSLRALTAQAPADARPWANLGQLLRDTERLDEAVAALRRAVALTPDHGPTVAVLGDCLHRLGRLHAADTAIRRSIALGFTDNPAVWTLLANNSRYLGRVVDVIDALERAFALAPHTADMHNNLGIYFTVTGRFDEAIEHFDAAIAAQPDADRWRANRGFTRLTAGDLAGGWADFERGLYRGGPRGVDPRPELARWTPADRHARVLCSREQGVGDEILFTSCLPDLASAARSVVFECDPRLVPLMARSFPHVDVRPQCLEVPAGDTDRSIPIGSLPSHFRPSLASFPADRRSYLVADPAQVATWRLRLDALGPRPKVAFSWRSRITSAERRLEYTQLAADWGPVFATPGVEWISVQYDDCERELRDAEQRFGVTIHRWDDVDYLDDFDAVAAILTASDLLLAPRNAVAMLGGALGVPTVMMGNRWDWSDLGTDSSPWFPSVELAYREWGDEWNQVIATAARRVSALASHKERSR